jgi:hypothetical protein
MSRRPSFGPANAALHRLIATTNNGANLIARYVFMAASEAKGMVPKRIAQPPERFKLRK